MIDPLIYIWSPHVSCISIYFVDLVLVVTPTTTGGSEGHIGTVLQLQHNNLQKRLRLIMDNFDNLSASEKAEAAELQRMIAVEQQKAQFQAQVRKLT